MPFLNNENLAERFKTEKKELDNHILNADTPFEKTFLEKARKNYPDNDTILIEKISPRGNVYKGV